MVQFVQVFTVQYLCSFSRLGYLRLAVHVLPDIPLLDTSTGKACCRYHPDAPVPLVIGHPRLYGKKNKASGKIIDINKRIKQIRPEIKKKKRKNVTLKKKEKQKFSSRARF